MSDSLVTPRRQNNVENSPRERSTRGYVSRLQDEGYGSSRKDYVADGVTKSPKSARFSSSNELRPARRSGKKLLLQTLI